MLNLVFHWTNTNEMSFGVNKCATIVVKNIIFKNTPNYVDPTFYIGMYSILKVTCYTYLGIPFDEDLSLKPILSNMYKKVQKSLFSLRSFLSNNSVPLGLKKIILQSFVISKINYYAPLLGSNKKRTSRVQSLINTGILWCINSFRGKGNSSNKKNKAFHESNSYISLYALSRDLIIPPLAGICATQQIKCFIKWRNSNCIIRDLVRDIPTIPLNNGIKALRYSNLQFKNSTSITRIGFQKPYLNIGIIWIIRIRCGFENTTRIAIASNRVTPDCPRYCSCCGHGEQTFLHWILLCPVLTQYRTTSLAFNELQIDKAEQRHLHEQLYSSSGSHVPYMEGLAAFLTKTIPIISSSMKLLYDRFSKTPNEIKSANVVSIGHRNLTLVPYTGSDVRNSLNDNINDSWESLVVTTLSNLMLLLSFISFNL
ncbi:hypothetical protein PIROE2DRAFT_7413 [Piromyces sp. E2]|nr:hypothetical protein PIROE2DRAFT_7413 [Piromyces sp. E2]|eukprot:OUM65571.1 hypothetical protein PIROE2DRAFT_7413 [Piromyces sp. E2]